MFLGGNLIMNNSPKISVVMSCYNRENFVRDAIESILNQTYTDFEFIIIDDCSTDKTPEIIQEYADKDNRIVYIRNEENMDYNYNLRKGFKLAKGEYIARMDDDDISLPERFEKQVSYLDEHPDITVLGSLIDIFGELKIESWVKETDPDVLNILMNFQNPMCHPSVMIRKSFLEENDLTYSPKELYAEEYDLWKNIILKGGKLANLPEKLVRYRVHKKTVTHKDNTGKIQQETAERVRKQLLTRFFNDKEYESIKDKLVMYPFECNNKKVLWQTLESMKARNNGVLSNDAIEYVKSKYCGIPSDIDIFFASDDNYAQHMCVAMTSILINSLPVETFNFHILDGGISDKNKKQIEKIKKIKNSTIEYIKIDNSFFANCPINPELHNITKHSYYRYLISKLKPDLDKCFYFDSDLLVMDSLNEFWNTDLEDNFVAAAEDLWMEVHRYYKNVYDLNCSFNAGVLLINNNLWKTNNISNKLFETTSYFANKNLIRFVDQDILNVVCYNKVKYVSPIYNLQQTAYFATQHSLYTEAEMETAKAHTVIIHYSGNIKPWHKGCLHPLWKKYYEYLKLSPYKAQYYLYKINKILLSIPKFLFSIKKSETRKRIKVLGVKINTKRKKTKLGLIYDKLEEQSDILNKLHKTLEKQNKQIIELKNKFLESEKEILNQKKG